MGAPVQVGGIPDDLKQQIDAYIAAELARRQVEANPPAKVESPEESAARLLVLAYAAERGEKAVTSGSGRTHEIILTLLSMLVERVMPLPSDTEAGN